jgi:hypothetical protein
MIFARFCDKKQTRWQNMAEIVFSWGVSEIKCIIFKENNDNPYEIHNIYIKLSIVLHPMIIFLGNKNISFLPGVLVILCIISNLPGVVHGHFLVKYYT